MGIADRICPTAGMVVCIQVGFEVEDEPEAGDIGRDGVQGDAPKFRQTRAHNSHTFLGSRPQSQMENIFLGVCCGLLA